VLLGAEITVTIGEYRDYRRQKAEQQEQKPEGQQE
jgi:membrane protein